MAVTAYVLIQTEVGKSGDVAEADALSEDALRAAGDARDDAAIARARAEHAVVAPWYADAAQRARAAAADLERVGDVLELARLCSMTAYTAIREREYREALVWLERGLDAARRLDGPQAVFFLRGNEGVARLFLGDLEAAEAAFGEALRVCLAANCEDVVDETLLGLAAVSARRGDLARAAWLTGAAQRHQMSSRNADEAAVWARLNDELLVSARERLGGEEWDHGVARGAALTVREVIDAAQGHANPAVAGSG